MLPQLNRQFETNLVAKKMAPTLDVWESLGNDRLLRPEFVKQRKEVSKMMDEVYQDLIPYINRCEFPHWILPKIKALGINGMFFKDFGGSGLNNLEAGLVFYEMAKKDGSISMFTLVHNALGMNLVNELGDSE